MKQIELQDFIKNAKKYMIDNSDRVNADKKSEFQDIDIFLEQELNDKEIVTIIEKIALLRDKITLKVGKEFSKYGSDFVSREIERSFYHLGIIYLLMIKSNKKLALKFDDEVLYLIVNSSCSLPCKNYDEIMKKMSYPDLIHMILKEGQSTNVSAILNALRERVIKSSDNFDETHLNEYMNNFMFCEVYPRLGIPDYIIGDERIKIELLLNKHSVLKFIEETKGMKNPYLRHINNKLDILSTYDTIDIPTSKSYLNYVKLFNQNEDNKFIKVIVQLTILGISQFIDITSLNPDDLNIIIDKVIQIPYDKFSLVLSSEKHR